MTISNYLQVAVTGILNKTINKNNYKYQKLNLFEIK